MFWIPFFYFILFNFSTEILANTADEELQTMKQTMMSILRENQSKSANITFFSIGNDYFRHNEFMFNFTYRRSLCNANMLSLEVYDILALMGLLGIHILKRE